MIIPERCVKVDIDPMHQLTKKSIFI